MKYAIPDRKAGFRLKIELTTAATPTDTAYCTRPKLITPTNAAAIIIPKPSQPVA